MKQIACRLSALALVLTLLLTMLAGCNLHNEVNDPTTENESISEELGEDNPTDEVDKITAPIAEIAKYGNLILNLSGAELFEKGYEYGDILEITVAGKTYELPMCSNYSDVDTGVLVMRAASAEGAVVIAINMGDFATTAGIAEKTQIEENPGYRWDYLMETPVQIEIAMKQSGGYYEQWIIRQLVRTDAREYYAHLSDEAFDNVRVIDTTGMGANKLYRSSSPINSGIGRSAYADAAAKNAGIVTVLNLADASNTYELPEDAYYNTCQVTYLNLGTEFLSETATASLAAGMRAIINGEGPILLHCNEGKDRAGFVSALLECLMGASIDEVIEDYMETYFNYYGVEKGTEKYDAVVDSNIIQVLNTNFKVSDVRASALAAEAETYMIEDLGLSAEEVAALKTKLGA